MNLVKYDAACVAIAEAKSVDEVKLIRDKAQAIQAAARIAKNHGMEIDAAEIRIRAERRLGEMLAEQKRTIGLASGGEHGGRSKIDGTREEPSNQRPTLAQAGIDKKLSSRSQAIAAIPQDDFEAALSEHREAQQAVTSRTIETLARAGTAHVSHNSGDNEWYTPGPYIEAARAVLGVIDLDPASHEEANKIVQASKIYTEQDSGLGHDWEGKLFMNPPYASDLVGKFIEKLAASVEAGAVTEAIVLVNNATDTRWFARLASVSAMLCLPVGRVKFWHPRKVAAPLQGQVVAYIGKRGKRFLVEFKKFGTVAEIVR